MALLVVSSDLPEVLTLADRIVVMADGRTVGELAGGDRRPRRPCCGWRPATPRSVDGASIEAAGMAGMSDADRRTDGGRQAATASRKGGLAARSASCSRLANSRELMLFVLIVLLGAAMTLVYPHNFPDLATTSRPSC